MKRVLIYDEYPLIQQGLAHALSANEDFSVCATTGEADKVLALVGRFEPDIAIISIDSGETSGMGLVGELRTQHPDLRVLVLSKREELHAAGAALQAGAKGFLNKSATAGQVLEALESIVNGNVAISDSAADLFISQLIASPATQGASALVALSRREMEILELTGCGLNRSAIAARLNLSKRTVDSYRGRLKRKLGLQTMPDLIRYAVNWLENADSAKEILK